MHDLARRVGAGLLVTLAAGAAGCARRADGVEPTCCVDLLQALPRAATRPVGEPDAVRAVSVEKDGQTIGSLAARLPSRVVFTLRIPRDTIFSAAISLDGAATSPPDAGAVFRVGISDGRTYEQLFERSIRAGDPAAWVPVRVDLGGYAGWQWSLFYHPSSIVWQIVLNTYPVGRPDDRMRGLWVAPAIARRE